jgi:hypothetical protein
VDNPYVLWWGFASNQGMRKNGIIRELYQEKHKQRYLFPKKDSRYLNCEAVKIVLSPFLLFIIKILSSEYYIIL